MLPDLPPLDLAVLAELGGASDTDGPLTDLGGESGAPPSGMTAGESVLRDALRTANSQRVAAPLPDGAKPFDTGARPLTIRNTVRNTPAVPLPTTPSEGRLAGAIELGLLPRDAAALRTIVRLRLASMQQVAALIYPGRSLVVARRRLRKLEHRGWITFWDRPSTRGAAVRYAVPTKRALAVAHAEFQSLATSSGFGQLLGRMLPARPRRLTAIPSGETPSWFQHQDEINRLLVAIVAAEGDRIVWYSSWDCPFPDRVNGLKAPQPDYVLVRKTTSGHAVTFGEHDRATEPLARWSEKIAAYAVAREVAREWLGIEQFTVDVTVVDPSPREPLLRVRELIDLAGSAGAASFMRFTLAGWLHAVPNGTVWFSNGTGPVRDSRCRLEHVEMLVA